MKYPCEKCLDDPCMCGHAYRDWTDDARLTLAAAVLGIGKGELQSALETPPTADEMAAKMANHWIAVMSRQMKGQL